MKKLILLYSSFLAVFYSLFLSVLRVACVNAADHSGMPETPIGYYQCISGAFSRQAPYLQHARELDSRDLKMTPVKTQNEPHICTGLETGACVEYYNKFKNSEKHLGSSLANKKS